MAKTHSNVSAVADKAPAANPKTTKARVAEAPKPKAPEPAKAPVKAEDRPLTSKHKKILLALKEGPKSSKEIQVATKLKSHDLSSYIGAVADAEKRYGADWKGRRVHEFWDRVARNPDRRDWNHISLLGRKLVEYRVPEGGGKGVFALTPEGEAEVKKIEAEEADSK